MSDNDASDALEQIGSDAFKRFSDKPLRRQSQQGLGGFYRGCRASSIKASQGNDRFPPPWYGTLRAFDAPLARQGLGIGILECVKKIFVAAGSQKPKR